MPPLSLTFSLLALLQIIIPSLLFHSKITLANVPSSATFKYVNEGEFGGYNIEYGADYRSLNIYNSMFNLFLYNTTPNAYTLALGMSTTTSTDSFFRWVWEANRGRPVCENATLSFGTDGNLVLAESSGRVVWQTNTANKGVTGLKLLPNGNLILHDKKGNFVWQSFHYPTDTLLVGQSLLVGPGRANKLVSRRSESENSDGLYTLVLGPKSGLSLYFNKQMYYNVDLGKDYDNLTFATDPDNTRGDPYYYLSLQSNYGRVMARPKYNSTMSFLRLEIDGNVKLYTYYDKVNWPWWEVTFSLFSRELFWESECQLPGRCGTFGVCENSQCVACPSPKGLGGWTQSCAPQKRSSCKASDFGYYEISGVDHFLSKYTSGLSITESDCRGKCDLDCKCSGYFYHRRDSKCWIAHELKTLTSLANSTHVGYIKSPKATLL